MKEEPWTIAFFHGFRLAVLCLIGVALFSVLTPGARAGAAPDRAAASVEACPAGLFDILKKEEKAPDDQAPKALVPVGHTVGIKLFSDGVLVVGLSQVDTPVGVAAPAKTCGL